MSSISSASSTTNPYQATNLNAFTQFVNDFNAIGSALQSGNLSDAQSALATFQQDLPGNSQTSTNPPFGNNSQANTDYQSLVSALKSGNLSDAQKAYASLQNDLQGTEAGKSHRHHHHHGSSDSDTTQTATLTAAALSSSDDADSGLDVTA
jgi:predicted RNA methylase